MSHNYTVFFEPFTDNHYIKKFIKKYKERAWDNTQKAIIAMCMRIDSVLLSKRADCISTIDSCKLVKMDFAVDGTHISPRSSGNRCILYINEEERHVRVLLVYSKNDISLKNETQEWKNIIKKEYSDIEKLFSL